MLALSHADLEGVGALGDQLTDAGDPAAFRAILFPGVRTLVGADVTTYNDVDVATGAGHFESDPAGFAASVDMARFAAVVGQNPMVARALAGDRTPLRFCDVTPHGEIRRTDLWNEFLHGGAGDYMLCVTLDAGDGHAIGLALSRSTREFADRDVAVLALLRPSIVLAHRIATARERPQAVDADALVDLGLTPRQASVVQWCAEGATNAQIAAALHIREATVAKHLERSYRRLGVPTRGAAVAMGLRATAAGRPRTARTEPSPRTNGACATGAAPA